MSFNLNSSLVDDLREVVTFQRRAWERTSGLDARGANVYSFLVAPTCAPPFPFPSALARCCADIVEYQPTFSSSSLPACVLLLPPPDSQSGLSWLHRAPREVARDY
jgi:hypothetical protein